MIPFADLKSQYHSIKPEIDLAIAATLESSQFILGKEVAAFEDEFAAFHGAAHGIGTNSGTSALHLALLAAGVGEGHEVITTPFTFVATAAAILYTGARPVYVDIEPETYNLDPARLAAAITPRTKAIVPVHLFGHPADMDPIMEIARRHGLVVVEDACQAHAAEYKGRRVGGIGDLACFSFYPGKNLGAYGEAGCVVSNNAELARTVRLLRNWGEESRYHHILRGYNYRMEGLQGAILRVKLRHLEAWTEARRSRARVYARALDRVGVYLPREMPWARHVYHVHAIQSEYRWDIQRELAAQGIQTAIH
jgi:dTDP-4-amino-4,6-dideoxygalactose transaminase